MRGTLHAWGALLLLPRFLLGRWENPKVEETLVSGPRCLDGKEEDRSPPTCQGSGVGMGGQQVGSSAHPRSPPRPGQSPPNIPFNI